MICLFVGVDVCLFAAPPTLPKCPSVPERMNRSVKKENTFVSWGVGGRSSICRKNRGTLRSFPEHPKIEA